MENNVIEHLGKCGRVCQRGLRMRQSNEIDIFSILVCSVINGFV